MDPLYWFLKFTYRSNDGKRLIILKILTPKFKSYKIPPTLSKNDKYSFLAAIFDRPFWDFGCVIGIGRGLSRIRLIFLRIWYEFPCKGNCSDIRLELNQDKPYQFPGPLQPTWYGDHASRVMVTSMQ